MHAVGTGVTPPGAVVPRLAPGPAPSRCPRHRTGRRALPRG